MPVHAMRSNGAEDAAAPPPAERDPAEVAPSDIRGLIDNATADRLYGWVWDAAHPGYRVKVELRLAGEVVATGIADRVRPDLAKHGIGDGGHAFEFPLLRQWFKQLRELSVVAYGRDGAALPLPVHAPRQNEMLAPAQATAQLQSAAEALMAEHRRVRQEIETLRLRSAQLPDSGAVENIARAGQDLQRRIDSLELWLTRLDGKLAEVAAPTDREDRSRLDPWQAALIAILVGAVSAMAAIIAIRYGF